MRADTENERRHMRIVAHNAFDKLWRRGGHFEGRRDDAYIWLARTMGLTKAAAHIAKFSVPQCRRCIYEVKRLQVATKEATP